MEPEKLIGKKVYGFEVNPNLECAFTEAMAKFIGKIGIIKYYQKYNNSFGVEFKNEIWHYPADQIEAHLVEDEIPTLSDGVMMLVSDDGVNFEPREVYGKKDNLFFVWGLSQESKSFSYKYAKPLEPTKEEQLTAILGSSEKVSEIMELFKN